MLFVFRLDYCGIAILTMGSFVPWLYYNFYCRLGLKIIYMGLTFSLGTTCIIVSLWNKFSEPRFRALRAGKIHRVILAFCKFNTFFQKLLETVNKLLYTFFYKQHQNTNNFCNLVITIIVVVVVFIPI